MTLPDRYHEDLLRSVFAGGRWIAAMPVDVSAAGFALRLRELGAAEVLGIAGSHGTGTVPEGVEVVCMDVREVEVMAGIRASEAALDDVDPAIAARVDAWDPDGQARVLRALFSHGRPVAGRPTWGARDPSWVALEDKTVVDALWDEVGVPRAPVNIVPVGDALRAAAALDRGLGTVWAGDSRSGWHGGASYTRWVQTDADAEAAHRLFVGACDRVRVMPFLEGVPCSSHGIVGPAHVAALRPCEMLVLRGSGSARLLYAAAATFWDPPASDRASMRAMVKRVGAHLRATLGYRGVFTIDGVMTADGFLPTELNPRFGAAIGVMTRGIEGLPAYLLHCALVAGEGLDWRLPELEAEILAHADAHRDGRVGVNSAVRLDSRREVALVRAAEGWREAHEGEEPDALASAGPSGGGTRAGANFVADRTPVGPSLAPRAAEVLRWMDQEWGLGLGELAPAVDVRPGEPAGSGVLGP